MAATIDPLAELRPIHWPEAISWWPPAPGWYLLLLLLLLALVTGLLLRKRHQKPSTRSEALALLRQLAQHDGDDRAFLAELNQHLKRIALARFPRQQAAGLSGRSWLVFLDDSSGGDAFTTGPGQALGQAPYQRRVQLDDRSELLALCEQWVEATWQQDRAH